MRRIRYGMVGGGQGAFIGEVHRMAARLDDCYELVCGAFSGNPERSRQSGVALGLDETRCYRDFDTMFSREAALPEDERMECVVIVTPNNSHYAIAMLALENGFHILSDKPATATLDECLSLAETLADTDLLYGLTHTYTGYPMIREARERVAAGQLAPCARLLWNTPRAGSASAKRTVTIPRRPGAPILPAPAAAAAWATSGCMPSTWPSL